MTKMHSAVTTYQDEGLFTNVKISHFRRSSELSNVSDVTTQNVTKCKTRKKIPQQEKKPKLVV
jgi:hypothetical protein